MTLSKRRELMLCELAYQVTGSREFTVRARNPDT